MEHYDLIVIGSGPAGRRAGIQAAKFGRNVLVVERGRRVGRQGAGHQQQGSALNIQEFTGPIYQRMHCRDCMGLWEGRKLMSRAGKM